MRFMDKHESMITWTLYAVPSVSFLFLLQYKLTVPKMGNVAELLAVLSKETSIPKDKVTLFNDIFGMCWSVMS